MGISQTSRFDWPDRRGIPHNTRSLPDIRDASTGPFNSLVSSYGPASPFFNVLILPRSPTRNRGGSSAVISQRCHGGAVRGPAVVSALVMEIKTAKVD